MLPARSSSVGEFSFAYYPLFELVKVILPIHPFRVNVSIQAKAGFERAAINDLLC